MRKLDSMKIPYKEYYYSDAVAGVEVAQALGENPEQVFKTLVTVGKSGTNYVFLVPVAEELDLKKAASSVGEKSIAMIKFFRTTIHQSAQNFDTIFCSGGKIGFQIQISLDDLSKVIKFTLDDIIK